MPKATMNENRGLVFREHNIWPPRKLFILGSIDGEPETELMEHATRNAFRLCVFPWDATHYPGSMQLGKLVSHESHLQAYARRVKELEDASIDGTPIEAWRL